MDKLSSLDMHGSQLRFQVDTRYHLERFMPLQQVAPNSPEFPRAHVNEIIAGSCGKLPKTSCRDGGTATSHGPLITQNDVLYAHGMSMACSVNVSVYFFSVYNVYIIYIYNRIVHIHRCEYHYIHDLPYASSCHQMRPFMSACFHQGFIHGGSKVSS